MLDLERNNKLPIGSLLQKAGLITSEQLQKALELQLQYSQMKLGEILILQQGIRVKTIDFFVDRWQETIALGQLFPLGYHLKQACLLTEKQIAAILQEQKSSSAKFGELAVRRGWIKQDTVDFFLANLPSEPPSLITLNELEKYNKTTWQLEKKYADCSLVLSRILAWTGGIPNLTETICRVFATAEFNIPSGQEIKAVDQFVEGTLIRKWRTSKAAASIRLVQQSLLHNLRCHPRLLLTEYRDILLTERQSFQDTKVQRELLLMGLVVREERQLRVSNIIYQQIFNRDFVTEQLAKIPPQISTTITENTENEATIKPAIPTRDNAPSSVEVFSVGEPASSAIEMNSVPIAVNQVKQSNPSSSSSTPEPLTRIGSIITCAAIALLIPLFLTINNYYSSLSQPQQQGIASTNKKINRRQQSCDSPDIASLDSLLSSISQLEANQKQFPQSFSDNCQITLNSLRVLAAPQLGRESRILEAIHHLCKVPANSEVYVDAEVWLERWYRSDDWGNETKRYIEGSAKHTAKSCPAAHFREHAS